MSVLRFEVYRDVRRAIRWRLVHRNGKIMADSAESYTRRAKCLKAIERLRTDVASAAVIDSHFIHALTPISAKLLRSSAVRRAVKRIGSRGIKA